VILSDTPQSHARGSGAVLRRIFVHRKLALILPAGIGLGLAYGGYLSAPSSYNSEAILVLDARKIQALPTESVVSPLPQESPVLRSELDIIASHTMAGRVIGKLSPAAVEMIRTGNPGVSIGQVVRDLLAMASSRAAPADPATPDNPAALEGALLSNLRVNNDGRSYTIFISYSAGDSELAADVANAFAESYLDYQVDIQGAGTRQVSDWLGLKLVNMRTSLESSERALNEFRRNANLLDANGVTTQAQRVAEAESELAAARAASAANRARLITATRQLRDTGELAIAEVNNASLIQDLKSELYRIERRIREITDGGAVMSAELPGLQSQLAAVERQMERTTKQIIESLTAEVEVAESRTASAEQALVAAKRNLEAANKSRVQEAQFEREAAANRTIYESYLARYKQTIEQEGIAAPDARIISRAEASQTRAGPRLQSWLMAGLSIGAAFGLAIAFLREITNRRVRSAASLAEETGYPVLGAVPNLPYRDEKRGAATAANSRFAEALVALQATIRRAQQVHKARVIAVTSSQIGDGKTMIAVNLARSMSAAGTNVLVIDCNFSRPAVAGHFATDRNGSLERLALERQNLTSLISIDSGSGVSVMAGSAGTIASGLVLANKNFRGLLARLRDRFDVILLDGPALSQSLDAWQVAAMADGVIMVVSKAKSRVDVAKSALEQLRDYGCQVLGIVIDRHVDQAIFPHAMHSARDGDARPAEPDFGKIYEFPEVAQSM
jgi:capsular exopolysaccharide synthesis family protein